MMPFKSFGRVLGLLGLLTFVLLSACVAPVLAATTSRIPVTPKAASPRVRVAIIAYRPANYVSKLYSTCVCSADLYAQALADVENFGAVREEPWPFPLPIAVSYNDFSSTPPTALPCNEPAQLALGKPSGALATKYRILTVRYAVGYWV